MSIEQIVEFKYFSCTSMMDKMFLTRIITGQEFVMGTNMRSYGWMLHVRLASLWWNGSNDLLHDNC